MSVDVLTFGCRLNTYESEVIRRQAGAAGVVDAVVVNTCAVTAEAVRQAKQSIRRIKREQPDARIVVTGCAAQTEPELFAAMPEVDRVVGNEEKLDARLWRTDDEGRGRRYHGGAHHARHTASMASTAAPAPSSRCRTAATTAAPSASSRSAAAIRAHWQWTMWWRRCAVWSRTAIAKSCSPASISPATAAAMRGWARW